jgi:hypothetical protein
MRALLALLGVTVGSLIVFAASLYSIRREKKRSS